MNIQPYIILLNHNKWILIKRIQSQFTIYTHCLMMILSFIRFTHFYQKFSNMIIFLVNFLFKPCADIISIPSQRIQIEYSLIRQFIHRRAKDIITKICVIHDLLFGKTTHAWILKNSLIYKWSKLFELGIFDLYFDVLDIIVPFEYISQIVLNYAEEGVIIWVYSKDICCHLPANNLLNIKFSSLIAKYQIQLFNSRIIQSIVQLNYKKNLRFLAQYEVLCRVKTTFFYFFNKLTFQVYRRMHLSPKTEEVQLSHTRSINDILISKINLTPSNLFSTKSVPNTGRSSKEAENRWEKSHHQYFCEKLAENQKQTSPLSLLRMPKAQHPINLSDLNKIEFSPLPFSIKKLAEFSQLILEGNQERKALGKTFNLPRLIQLLAGQYRSVAYHNFTHAFSVLQLLFQSYNRCQILRKCISQKLWFFAFLAALAHDLSHPGTNNAFQIKSRSMLAIEAGNECVLQKMHLRVLWSILKKYSQVNFLQGLSSHQSNTIKKFITRLVLSTDIGNHFNGLSLLKQLEINPQPLEGDLAISVVQQVFHACDVGNPCLEFQDYINWAALISYQFNEIAVNQEHLGLEPSHYLKYTGKKEFYSSQMGFCSNIVLPLWKEITMILPGLREFKENIESNLAQLKKEMNKL